MKRKRKKDLYKRLCSGKIRIRNREVRKSQNVILIPGIWTPFY